MSPLKDNQPPKKLTTVYKLIEMPPAKQVSKTEFPQNWCDEKILHYVSDIATDPNATWGMGK